MKSFFIISRHLLFVAILGCPTILFAQDPLTKPPKKTQQQDSINNTVVPSKPQKNNRPESHQFTRVQRGGDINGYEYVDLGLNVKWATCNVDASIPTQYGEHYAWGETSIKTIYIQGNSLLFESEKSDIVGSRNDVARFNWGSTWRMPTFIEIKELLEKCQWTWVKQDGHQGYLVTGPSGHSIFLPAAGLRDGSSLHYVEECGYYWCSTPDESDTRNAYHLDFNSNQYYLVSSGRYLGQNIRPVSE